MSPRIQTKPAGKVGAIRFSGDPDRAPGPTSSQTPWIRSHVYVLSRFVVCAVIAASMGTLFLAPSNPLVVTLDVLFRAYVMFLGTVMAHEGTHGHLGRTKSANFWWGRLALIPTMVPFTNFVKTHHLHHANTNIPDRDPDLFMKPRYAVELPFRAILMPHQWFFWLKKRGKIKSGHVLDLVLNYIGIFAAYAIVLAIVGPSRLLWGVVPALVLVSLLLWYPFAFKVHEGFSTGSSQSRSHDYYGRLMYWLSLGLSMHREHHTQPSLSWIELRDFVKEAPDTSWINPFPKRDIRPDTPER